MDDTRIAVNVSCYAGYRGEETPQRFSFKDKHIEVVEIIDRWLAPDHRYFKVQGDDDVIYTLRHDIATGLWELTLYDRTQQLPEQTRSTCRPE